ncbi:MAG: hypothetical protein AAF492_24490, partial [Verrucomicrobiota bacterium]
AWGFRNDPKVEETWSLVLIGDSFGVGSGTTQNETMAAVLRQKAHIPTYNLSQVGSINQHLLNLQLEFNRLSLRENAVVALLAFGGNDLRERHLDVMSADRLTPNSAFGTFRQKWQSYKRRTVFRKLFHPPPPQTGGEQIRAHPSVTFKTNCSQRVLFHNPYIEAHAMRSEDLKREKNYPLFQSSIEHLAAFCAEKKLRLCVFNMPTKAEVYGWMLSPEKTAHEPSGFSEVLAEECHRQQIAYVDLGPELFQQAKDLHASDCSALLWWRDDTHINPRGHAAVAGLMAKHVKDFLPEPAP